MCVCVCAFIAVTLKSDVRVNRMPRFAVIPFCHIHWGGGGGGEQKDKQ